MRFAALLALLAVDSFVPGFVLLRRRPWAPLEIFGAAIGLSLVLVYVFTLAVYFSGLPMAGCGAFSLVSILLAVWYRGDVRAHLAEPRVREVAAALAALSAWVLAFAGLVRHFSGGGWGIDWLEHFHRCLFFLLRLPADTVLHGNYHLTARPPMMNVLGAFFLAQTSEEFASFQVAFTVLNVLAFAGAAVVAAQMIPGGRPLLVLAALFALNPLFIENATYTWTKLLSAFFVLLAIAFERAEHLGDERVRTAAVSIALAAGILVHYSAIPFAMFVAAHHLWRLSRREPPARWPGRLIAGAPGLLLLSTWIVWAFAVYGPQRSLTSNTAVGDSRHLSFVGNMAKVGANVVDTLVPHPLRGVALESLAQDDAWGRTRDYFFLVYQTSFVAAVGCVAGVVAAVRLVLALRRGRARFWGALVAFGAVLGIATHGGRDLFGVTHVTLQPLVLLGLVAVAAAWPVLPRRVRLLVIAGSLIDFTLGVALQHHVESFDNEPGREIFSADATVGPDGLEWKRTTPLSRSSWEGWRDKQGVTLLERQRERAAQLPPHRARRLLDAVEPELARFRARDAERWGGWFERHRRVTLLGDRLAPVAPALRVVIATGFAAILLAMWRATRGS